MISLIWVIWHVKHCRLFNNESSLHIFFLNFHHTTRESTGDTLSLSAANQGDNTASVAEGGTATPGATKQLLPPDRVFKRNIYTPDKLKADITLDVRSSSF